MNAIHYTVSPKDNKNGFSSMVNFFQQNKIHWIGGTFVLSNILLTCYFITGDYRLFQYVGGAIVLVVALVVLVVSAKSRRQSQPEVPDTDEIKIDEYPSQDHYQLAEPLIPQATHDYPDCDECKLKLLQTFYTNENKAAFEAFANELAFSGKQDEAGFWEKTAEMGHKICPNSPLFSSCNGFLETEEGQPLDAQEPLFEALASDDFANEMFGAKDNGLDNHSTISEVSNDGSVDDQRNNQDIEFDLSSFSLADIEPAAPTINLDKSPATAMEEIDFDLGSFSAVDKEPVVITGDILEEFSSKPYFDDLDFDFSAFSAKANDSDELAAPLSETQKTELTHLSSVGFSYQADDALDISIREAQDEMYPTAINAKDNNDSGLVTVTHPSSLNPPGFIIPDSPAPNASIQLDMNQVDALKIDSQKVTGMLGVLFEQDTSSDILKPIQNHADGPIADDENLLGLDKAHSNLIKLLCTQIQWTRAELGKVVSDAGMMLDGALEHINDAAYEAFNAALTEGDDPIDINQNILKELLK